MARGQGIGGVGRFGLVDWSLAQPVKDGHGVELGYTLHQVCWQVSPHRDDVALLPLFFAHEFLPLNGKTAGFPAAFNLRGTPPGVEKKWARPLFPWSK